MKEIKKIQVSINRSSEVGLFPMKSINKDMEEIVKAHLNFQFTAKEEFTGRQFYGYYVKSVTHEHFIVGGMSDTEVMKKGNALSFSKWHRIQPETLEVIKLKKESC